MEVVGSDFNFPLGLTFSFRPKLLPFSYWCGDGLSRANYTSMYILYVYRYTYNRPTRPQKPCVSGIRHYSVILMLSSCIFSVTCWKSWARAAKSIDLAGPHRRIQPRMNSSTERVALLSTSKNMNKLPACCLLESSEWKKTSKRSSAT